MSKLRVYLDTCIRDLSQRTFGRRQKAISQSASAQPDLIEKVILLERLPKTVKYAQTLDLRENWIKRIAEITFPPGAGFQDRVEVTYRKLRYY